VPVQDSAAAHSAIQRNLAISVGSRLRGKPCRFYGHDLKIETATTIRYPDGFVVCSPRIRGATVIPDPVVIFEVLSDSSARTDLVVKNHEYAAMPSVRRYVVLSQNEMAGSMFERIGTDWVGHLLGPDSVLRMPELELELPLAELYEGVDLDDASVTASAPANAAAAPA
jgi:Uma2 family endonuclease